MGDILGKYALVSSFLGELGVALRKDIFMRKLRALEKSKSINLCPRQILCLEIRGESTVWSAANGESTHTKCTKYWRSTRKMFVGRAERDTPSKKISFSFNKYQNVKMKCRSKPPTRIEGWVWQKYPIFTTTCLSNCYWLANLNKQSHLEVLSRKLDCVKTKASETPSLELRRENISSAWLSMCWCDHNWREAPSSHPIFAKKRDGGQHKDLSGQRLPLRVTRVGFR